MKKVYQDPIANIDFLNAEDVISTSTLPVDDNGVVIDSKSWTEWFPNT